MMVAEARPEGKLLGEPDDQAGHCHQTGVFAEDLAEKDLALEVD